MSGSATRRFAPRTMRRTLDSAAVSPERLGGRVTLNTDNRLMSGTSMTREAMLLVERVGWTRHDLRTMAINAMKSAFLPHPERVALIETVLKPAYS